MRRLILAALLAGLASGPVAAAEPAEGLWLVQDKDAKVRVGPCRDNAERLCGEIVWLQTPRDEHGAPKHDEHNKDPALRGRPILGLAIIRDFHAAGSGRWEGGKIYDPRSGKTYASKLQVEPDGTLRVDGCVLSFCKRQTWTRAQ